MIEKTNIAWFVSCRRQPVEQEGVDHVKKCPQCAEPVQDAARVCRYCGHKFDTEAEAAAKAKQTSTGEAVGGCAVIVVVLLLLSQCIGGDDKPDPAKAKAETAKSESDRRNGFHCLSGWDGNSRQAESALKATLRDPESMETIETKITPANEKGKHVLLMKYRARNGFGGMNAGSAIFLVDPSTCAADLVTSGDQ